MEKKRKKNRRKKKQENLGLGTFARVKKEEIKCNLRLVRVLCFLREKFFSSFVPRRASSGVSWSKSSKRITAVDI